MAPDSLDIVLCIVHEHRLVIRVRAVPRIGKPEVLPDHQAVTVAGFVKLLVADLAHPVAYHIAMHVLMVCYRNVVFALPVSQIALGEAPVASKRVNPDTIDHNLRPAVKFVVSHFADSCLVADGIGDHSAALHLESGIVQERFAEGRRPPEIHFPVPELREIFRPELHLEFRTGLDGLLLFKLYVSYPAAYNHLRCAVHIIFENGCCRHRGLSGSSVNPGQHYRVAYPDSLGGGEIDVVPYSDLAARGGCNPVPANGSVECRVVGPENASVEIGCLSVLDLYRAEMLILLHCHLQGIARRRND